MILNIAKRFDDLKEFCKINEKLFIDFALNIYQLRGTALSDDSTIRCFINLLFDQQRI